MADMPLPEALAYSNEMFASLCVTEDAREGVDAFLHKRSAVWQGR
jgi:enoyl-CoA hydratase/carnithine racemase